MAVISRWKGMGWLRGHDGRLGRDSYCPGSAVYGYQPRWTCRNPNLGLSLHTAGTLLASQQTLEESTRGRIVPVSYPPDLVWAVPSPVGGCMGGMV